MWDRADFEAAYSIDIRWPHPLDPVNMRGERIGQIVTYGRDFALYCERSPDLADPAPFYTRRAQRVFPLIQSPCLVVGAAYGYLVNRLRALGAQCFGIDASRYIFDTYPEQCLHPSDVCAWGDIRSNNIISLLSVYGAAKWRSVIFEDCRPVPLPFDVDKIVHINRDRIE